METNELLRKTLKTMGVMVGACVAFVGTLTFVVLVVVGHAVGAGDHAGGDPTLVPASKIDGQRAPEAPPASPRPMRRDQGPDGTSPASPERGQRQTVNRPI